MGEMDTTVETAEETEPSPFDLERITEMVNKGAELAASGIQPGTTPFNKEGGLDLHGFKAWRAAHADDNPENAAELDALEKKAPLDPEVESDEDRAARAEKENAPTE